MTFAFEVTGKAKPTALDYSLRSPLRGRPPAVLRAARLSRLKHAGMTIAGAAALCAATGNRHFNDSDDWSTATPGPIVELIEIFCR